MTTVRNLYQISEMYYFRTRVPFDLRLWFDGQEDFKRSLKTKSLKQARRLLRVWNYRTEVIFTLMRSGMLTLEQIKKLADNYKSQTLADCETHRGTTSHNDIEHEVHLTTLEEHEESSKRAIAYNDLSSVKGITDTVIEEYGLGEVSTDEYVALARELLKRSIEISQIEQQRHQGNYQNGYDDLIAPIESPAPVMLAPVTSPLLSTMIDKHIEDLKRKDAANIITIMGYSGICQLFLRIVGDVPVTEITRDTLRVYLDTLKQLPPNLNKVAKFKGKTIQQIIEMNEGQKSLAAHTVGKAVTTIKTLFTWMVAEELIDKNISSVLVPPKKEKAAEDERKVYTKDDLQRLVAGLNTVEELGELTDRPERYWLPLLALFSGARLNELCQLHIDDVTQIDDIWCIKIQPDDAGTKQVKTAASIRIVPVHKQLIELGFIEYLESVKAAKQPRLWMKLTLDSRGKYNRNFSNWFLKSVCGEGFLRTYITKDDGKDYHSLRHTMINRMKQSDVDEVKIAELVGHTNSSMTTGRYGKRYEIQKMKETIDSLHYEGVEFHALDIKPTGDKH